MGQRAPAPRCFVLLGFDQRRRSARQAHIVSPSCAAKGRRGDRAGVGRVSEQEDRDRISKAVMEDPQVKESMDPSKMPFDGKRMFWGGFETITEFAGAH